MGESGWKSAQPTYRSLTKRPPSTTAYGGGPLPRRGRLSVESFGAFASFLDKCLHTNYTNILDMWGTFFPFWRTYL